MAKISVIMPVYNAADYLRECLDSVLGQTERDLEVICINDGSTDGSKSLLEEYATKDPRVRIIDQDNHGAGYSRNQGLKFAQGQYVAFMDPDDLYPDDRVLEDLLAKMKEHKVRACGGCMVQFFADGHRLEHYSGDNAGYEFLEEAVIDYKDYQFEYGYTRFLYERSLIGEIKFPEYLRFQDPPFFVRVLAAAGRFCALPRVTYLYRNTPKTIDWKANGYRKVKDYLRGMANVAAFAREHGFNVLLDRLVNRLAVGGGRFLWDGAYMHALGEELALTVEAIGPQRTAQLMIMRVNYREKGAAHKIGTALTPHVTGFASVKDVVPWEDGAAHWVSMQYMRRGEK